VTVSKGLGVLSGFVVLLAAACGPKKSEEGKAEKECGAAPATMAGQPTLPPKFPNPDKVTYTGVTKTGPSTIVKGYREGELAEAVDDYKSASDRPATTSPKTRRKRTTQRSTSRAAARPAR
jgi:hypothetical protein